MKHLEKLSHELWMTLESIDAQMDVIRKDAERIGASPAQMMDSKGGSLMTPLLNARATTLSALATLETVRTNE